MEYCGLLIEPLCFRVRFEGEVIDLAQTEFQLLGVFLDNIGTVLDRDQLLRLVWKERSTKVDKRTVDVHVSRLRRALASKGAAHLLHTVRGHGYMLE